MAAGAVSAKRSLSASPAAARSPEHPGPAAAAPGYGVAWGRPGPSDALGPAGGPAPRAVGPGPDRRHRCPAAASTLARRRSRQVAGVVDRIAQQGCKFFWKSITSSALSRRSLKLSRSRVSWAMCSASARWGSALGPRLTWRQSGQIGDFALAAPGAQRRRVHALSAHQRTDLAGLGAAVGGVQNAALVGVGERPAPGTGDHFGIGYLAGHGRRRSGRIFSRPAGSLRCTWIG